MKRYKHYSFDLWMTLIKSNPEFKRERTKFFFDKFNSKEVSFKEVDDIIRHVDVSTNTYCEMSGKHVDSRRMIYDILVALEYKPSITTLNVTNTLIQEMFLDNPPRLYSNETYESLKGIKNSGASMNISSNTGFIHGDTLRKALKILEIHELFDFFIFSDEIEYSKPNGLFFRKVYSRARDVNSRIFFREYDSILHIGDNSYADIEGAKRFGFNAFQINTNDKTILDILL